jgi:hypothetical protein
MVSDPIWRPGDSKEPAVDHRTLYRPEILETIEATIKSLSKELRALSLDISGV